ncbi:MAG: peptidylprolyl isomerase [Gammaproteobacteria bacterium]
MVLVTSQGEITVELAAAEAPKSTANFLEYVRAGFYDGTIFHRVIPGFMIQGGGYTPAMARKETGDPIENEAANGLANTRGTLAMARTSDPHSATAQFFVNVVDNDFLDHREPSPRGWGYAVFGRVVDGMDVVDAIAATPTGRTAGMSDVPLEAVVIERAYESGSTAEAP